MRREERLSQAPFTLQLSELLPSCCQSHISCFWTNFNFFFFPLFSWAENLQHISAPDFPRHQTSTLKSQDSLCVSKGHKKYQHLCVQLHIYHQNKCRDKVSDTHHVEESTGLNGQKPANTLLRRAWFCCSCRASFGYQTNGFALHLPAISRRQQVSDTQEVCDPRLCVVLRITCFVWLFPHSPILSLPLTCTWQTLPRPPSSCVCV